jgi:membrane-bound lytic murein transglycosylase F
VRNIFFNFEFAFASGQRSDLAWMIAPGGHALARELDAFLARVRNDGVLARYAQRYFARERRIERVNASVFAERMKTALPQYRKLLHEAQAATGIDWRLLAAVAYQESQWDPGATSETGVRGFMQLTDDTARHLGIADRLDPQASAMGAARYLQDLKTRLPGRIVEPDRTWFALAAFNIGLGHLEDARVLAQRQKRNPDLWSDVQKVLPLLALPDYYETAKNGYARGGMPVAFVDRVRAFYDILLRQEPPYMPALRVPALAGK